MSDTEARLRAALNDIADSDAPAVRQVDVAAFRRVRTRWIGTGVGVVAAAAVGAFALSSVLGGGDPRGTNVVAAPGTVTSQPGDEELPRLLTVQCGAGGESDVSASRIAAAPDGVHIKVDRGTASTQDSFSYSTSSGRGGGMNLPEVPTSYLYDMAPGEIFVSCDDPSTADQKTISVMVVDPDGYYEEVDPEKVLGCAFTGQADGPATTGTSGLDAAQNYVTNYVTGTGTLVPATGYVDDPARDFLLDSPSERAELQIFSAEDGTFTAGISGVCSLG